MKIKHGKTTRPHAGIAGPACAHFLAKANIRTTIIERASSLRQAGQQIDIRGAGLTVVRHMGLEDAIHAKTTKEAGLAFVDSHGRKVGEFPVGENGGGMSFTSDIEILRGELSQIFYDASVKDTEYIFGNHVTDLKQTDDHVLVTFAQGGQREFDLVIGADGMGSNIRRLTFPSEQNALKPLGQYTSFFTIPYKDTDGTFAQWYNAPGGRCILLRPDNDGCTRAYLSIMSPKPAGYFKLSIMEQKKMMHELFHDAGWEAARVLEGMDTADDFYMQEIAQIKMPSWTHGRVALLGDAGYCPSPISGMGTTLAIIGAYVLAGEIAKNVEDFGEGFRGYEKVMKPYVTKAQSLPPGVPAIANPQTRWGISILYGIIGFVSWSGIASVIGKFSRPPAMDNSLPSYEF